MEILVWGGGWIKRRGVVELGRVLNFDKVFKQGLMVHWTRFADAL